MDLKIAACLLVLFVTVTISEGGVFQCCVKITKKISLHHLHAVDKYDIQKKSGFCEMEAVILHVNGKKYCVSPKLLPLLKRGKASRKKRLSYRD